VLDSLLKKSFDRDEADAAKERKSRKSLQVLSAEILRASLSVRNNIRTAESADALRMTTRFFPHTVKPY
jgi:hypothetical protein